MFSDDKNCASISKYLRHGDNVYFYETADSTNAIAKTLGAKGEKEGTLVVADKQTAGRGRLGRSFFSPDGGIYMSLLLRPQIALQEALFITAAAAVAVCHVIERETDKKCLIKWVNDIYIDGRKVCGILTEGAVAGGETLEYAVLGIGINLTCPSGGFPQDIADRADAIFGNESISAEEKARITAAVADEFLDIYSQLGSKSFMREYQSRSFLNGLTVCFNKDGIDHTAKVIAIDDDAKLIVEENGKKIALDAGDVSVKPKRDNKKR